MDESDIIIVSGLPRSGTSMMMKMLEAGGVELLVDGIRTPDEDNPKGYYEFERVKQIEEDQSWLEDARGRAVKMIAALLKHLPASFHYRVIFVRRDMEEVLASQRQMLVRRGEATDVVSDERMSALFSKHLGQVEAWLREQPNVETLFVHYAEILSNPMGGAKRIDEFLGGELGTEAMAAVVDPTLYRQRQ
jgi:hypothetical protein